MRRFDLTSIACIVLILLAGFSTLYSIGSVSGEPILYRQLLALVLAIAVFVGVSFLDYRLISQYSRHLYIMVIVLLGAVLLFGSDVRGSSRWLDLGPLSFQPVEFAKIVLIILLAKFFAQKRGEVKNVKVLLHSAAFVFLPVVLVMLQPDLGSAVLLFAIWFALLMFTPLKKSHVLILMLIILTVGATGWFGFMQDYQKERVITFLRPETDPQGAGYNVNQSIIAVGSGQFWGRGLGRGFQSHLKFLPERHTDFIFASFAEELGFLGAFLLLTAFGVLFWRLIVIAHDSLDSLGTYITLGVAVLIMSQVIVNIGMNVGLMPVTGITLPLVSYGGSSLVATAFLLGLTQNVYRRSKAGV